jgi:hypothetical protein
MEPIRLVEIVLQAFFRPRELEDYLTQKPAARKRIIWQHVALASIWFGSYFLFFYLFFYTLENSPADQIHEGSNNSRWAIPLASMLIIYLVTILIGLACGGIFKRDSVVSFVVGVYSSIIASICYLVAFYLAFHSRSHEEIIYTALVPVGLVIICSMLATVIGRTSGIKIAACVFFGISCLLVIGMLNRSWLNPETYLIESKETGQKYLLIEGYPDVSIRRGRGIFLETFPNQDGMYLLDLQSHKGERLDLVRLGPKGDPPGFYPVFVLTDDGLSKLEKKVPSNMLQVLGDKRGKEYGDARSFRKDILAGVDYWDLDRNWEVVANQAFTGFEISIDNETFVLRDPHNNLIRHAIRRNESLKASYVVINGKRIEFGNISNKSNTIRSENISLTVAGAKEPVEIYGHRLEKLMLLQNNLLSVQTERGIQLVNPETGDVATVLKDGEWYPTDFFEPSETWPPLIQRILIDFYPGSMEEGLYQNQLDLPMEADNTIYGCSPSGYFFAIDASADGPNDIILKEAVYAGAISSIRYRVFFYIAGVYTLGGTLILFLGLYRIPSYVCEAGLQVLSLIRVSASRKNPDAGVSGAPLFFDHISTLPLPFSKRFLRRVADKNPKLCSERLLYLLEKTQHQKLAARFFQEFHTENRDLLFDYLYKSLRSEKEQPFEEIIKESEDRSPIGNLIRSYNSLLTDGPTKSHLETHITILRSFAERDYRHARELFLTYEVFQAFLALQNLRELAQADRFLSEVLRISYAEVLNAQVIELFNVIVELSNDLKNYDLVDNFRDKQYYLSEARIKLYEISRRALEALHDPERAILLEIIEKWQGLIIAESKSLRGPAELEICILNRSLTGLVERHPILVNVNNVGQSPAENIRISLLDNENVEVLESSKAVRLLGTGESAQVEFFITPKGNPSELRMYFDTVFDDFERKNKLRPFADIVSLSAYVEVFRKIPNPYIVGTPLQTDKVFYGRRKALDFAVENLSSGLQNNALIFFGQRRIGKSSILYRLMESPLKQDYLFVYIDCQGFADADTAKLLYRICRDIHTSASRSQFLIDRPEVKRFKENTFLELDDYLDKVESALDPKRIVLMFDEYEFLEYKVKDGSVSPEIFNNLRNLMQHRNRTLAFIFVGTHRLTELTENYWSFLFNTALYHEIGSLGAKEARGLVTEPVKGFLRYDDLAIDKILRVTGLHPYFIQVTCRLIVNSCNERQKTYVTLTDINEILKEAVEGSTAHVNYLYKDYATRPEQEVLAFLSRVTDESKLFATTGEVIRFAAENQFEYDRKYVQEILLGLKNKKLVREDGEYRGELFGFEFEFLRIWIERHVKVQNGFVTLL